MSPGSSLIAIQPLSRESLLVVTVGIREDGPIPNRIPGRLLPGANVKCAA